MRIVGYCFGRGRGHQAWERVISYEKEISGKGKCHPVVKLVIGCYPSNNVVNIRATHRHYYQLGRHPGTHSVRHSQLCTNSLKAAYTHLHGLWAIPGRGRGYLVLPI
ncbi:hypothetical protein ACF0H5_010498 [Mactra antiquata]